MLDCVDSIGYRGKNPPSRLLHHHITTYPALSEHAGRKKLAVIPQPLLHTSRQKISPQGFHIVNIIPALSQVATLTSQKLDSYAEPWAKIIATHLAHHCERVPFVPIPQLKKGRESKTCCYAYSASQPKTAARWGNDTPNLSLWIANRSTRNGGGLSQNHVRASCERKARNGRS